MFASLRSGLSGNGSRGFKRKTSRDQGPSNLDPARIMSGFDYIGALPTAIQERNPNVSAPFWRRTTSMNAVSSRWVFNTA